MALSRDKQIIVGVVVLAALGGLVYRQQKVDANKGSPAAAAAELPAIGTSEEVDKFVISAADKPEVTLEKRGDKWFVTKPVEAPANQGNVKSLIDNLKEVKAKEVIASEATDELKKAYELADKATHVVAWKGGTKVVDVSFGKYGGRGQVTMVDGKPAIYASSGYSSYLYARDVKLWRDTEIFKFDEANATQVTLETKRGTFSFTKGDKWSGTFKGRPIDHFEESKVKDLLRTYQTLNAEDFGDGKPASETGLDSPEATISITLKDNAGKYVLKIGKTQSGSSRYAQKEGDSTIFVVPSYAADYAVAEESKFQPPKDGGKDST